MEKTNQTINIMVVEDELIVAKHIRSHLERAGYHVAAQVSTGEEAVKQVEEIQSDLILMDIRLAGQMDGIEAAEKIRARFNIPIIYLTAYADRETLVRSRVTEPFGYLVKPFEAKALHSSIEIALYRHRMEKKLKESEARFRTLAESAPVGIFQADVNGGWIYLNRKGCEITGLTPGESGGQGWAGRLHPDDRERVYSHWHQMVHSGEIFALEYRFRTPGGRVTWVFGQSAALEDEAGNKTGYIGTLSDITDRKKLEEELLTARKLESLGILAGGIAHDFNNLLSIIMGNISMVKDEIPPYESHYTLLDSAEKASSEAAGLAQKLITFSKGGWLMRKPVSLQKILKSAIENTLAQTDIFWEMDIPPDLLLLYGDEKQLQQVFCNLVRNAAEAVGNRHENEHPGKITLQARNRQLEDDRHQQLKPGKYVSITIEDNGAGIRREHLRQVFDPYFSTKDMGPRKGMGLGLAICYSIVTKHGGAIKIESEYGKGTVVEIYLPAFSEEAGVSAKGKQDEAAHREKTRIILMDDDQNILNMTGRMLTKMGYNVETFAEGGAVLQAYKKAKEEHHPFDAVLLDIVIKKGMEGKETLKKLLELDPDARVMAISGYVDDSDVADLKKKGFLEVLVKPFRRKELEQALDKVLPEK